MLIKAQAAAQMEGDAIQIIDDVRRSLIRTPACVQSLVTSGLSLGSPLNLPVNLTSVVDENGRNVTTLGKSPHSNLHVEEIIVELNKSNPTIVPNSLVVADLVVVMKTESNFGIQKKWIRKSPLTLEIGPSGNLVGCNSLSVAQRASFEKSLCQSMGGTYNTNKICDLNSSETLINAVCSSMGLRRVDSHCE